MSTVKVLGQKRKVSYSYLMKSTLTLFWPHKPGPALLILRVKLYRYHYITLKGETGQMIHMEGCLLQLRKVWILSEVRLFLTVKFCGVRLISILPTKLMLGHTIDLIAMMKHLLSRSASAAFTNAGIVGPPIPRH